MLYLEIGNTTLKLAQRTPEGTFQITRFTDLDSLRAEIPLEASLLVAPIAEERGEAITNALQDHAHVSVLHRDLFFDFIGESYDTPDTLGLDRILNLYALHRDGVVISCGTAITIDALSRGKPFWGAIMPGFRTASEGLSAHAPALPVISVDDLGPIPARTSRGALANGIIWGTVIGVQGLALTLAQGTGLPEDVPVIVTGGEAEIMTKIWLSDYDLLVESALLFEGMERKAQSAAAI